MNASMEPVRVMLVGEAADTLRVSPKTIRRMCRDGRLAACRVGREWRVSAVSVLDLLDFGGPSPVPAPAPAVVQVPS